MPDIDLSVLVTRPEIGLDPLELNSGPFKVVRGTFGMGNKSWRRMTADSPWVEGRALVHAVLDTVTVPLTIRVRSNQLLLDMQKVINSFSQFSYEMSFAVDGDIWATWTCEPADMTAGDGGIFQPFHYMAGQQNISLAIPRLPSPTVGYF